jgi:ubiquinone/menaquinone biosynthesis C-methylase UbiE
VFTAPDAYDRFMGRYSKPLAQPFADFAGVASGQDVLDVGCGPGALTSELVERVGTVTGVDPSEPFVAAFRDRYPGLRVELAPAEDLPFEDASFDAALAQLVVHFMSDPLAGLREMARVTRDNGFVAACVWDLSRGGVSPLSVFWEAVRDLDPAADDESQLAGSRQGHLGEILEAAGLREIEESVLEIHVEHPSFEEWWEPFTLGVGPAGSFASKLEPAEQDRVRERCREKLPTTPFMLTAHAWAARGVV